MRRLFLITLLMLSSGPAYAEWVEVTKNVEAGMTVYVDPDTIRRKGDLVKMWSLHDYKTIQTLPGYPSYLSSVSQSLYDCAEERSQLPALTWFSGNMRTGKVVYNGPYEQKWVPVSPNSIGRDMWEVACAKK